MHPAKTMIGFSGYQWSVKDGLHSPGPNHFSAKNAQVDSQGRLHLRIRRIHGEWACAEIILDHALGYGTYSFEIIGDPNTLDKSTVLGMFTYDEEKEPDHREIDIEWSRWGKESPFNARYSVQPSASNGEPIAVCLQGKYSRHEFIWRPEHVDFTSRHGHDSTGVMMAEWSTRTDVPAAGNEQVHINFWMFRGNPPSKNQEIIIRRFTFTPLH
jgi:hypothetical protein